MSPAVFLYAYSVLVESAHVASRDGSAAGCGTVHSSGRCGPENTGPLIGWFTTASDAVALPAFTGCDSGRCAARARPRFRCRAELPVRLWPPAEKRGVAVPAGRRRSSTSPPVT